MQHRIPSGEHGPRGEVMAHAIEACVHCGFCLPACPTYAVLGEEMDSPRGRIFLMKEVLEGSLPLDDATPYVDRCLGCVACETACPSGVEYGELLTSFRAHAEPRRVRSLGDRLLRAMVLGTLPYPRRLRQALRVARRLRWLAPALPRRVRAMLELAPGRLPDAGPQVPEAVVPAVGPRRARVAVLVGCAQRVLAPEIHAATVRVLARNGVEVVVPPAQGCCGALSLHAGAERQAARFAARTLDVFARDVDAVITDAAGCGSGMKEYALLLRGSEREDDARRFAGLVQDIASFLDELGIIAPAGFDKPLRVAYHDACHLLHAQRVREAPRRLLGAIPGVELLEPANAERCCGSAGTYNIEEPEIARELGEQKARALAATRADLVAAGNIGCIAQLRACLPRIGATLEVRHTIEVLDRAYAGDVA